MPAQPFSTPPPDEPDAGLLSVETAVQDPATVVVTPIGEADLSTAPTLRRALRRASSGRPCVIVDLDRLTFLDATTLDLLVEARHRISATGGTLLVRCHTRPASLLLRTVGLDFMLDQNA
jgi:anti-anti-sigma factor